MTASSTPQPRPLPAAEPFPLAPPRVGTPSQQALALDPAPQAWIACVCAAAVLAPIWALAAGAGLVFFMGCGAANYCTLVNWAGIWLLGMCGGVAVALSAAWVWCWKRWLERADEVKGTRQDVPWPRVLVDDVGERISWGWRWAWLTAGIGVALPFIGWLMAEPRVLPG